MADQISIIVQEVEGDTDTANVNLVVPATAINNAASGDVLGGKVLEAGGFSFLFVTAAASDLALPVEELKGDAEEGTRWVVTPKATLGASAVAGTHLDGFVFTRTGGSVLVLPL